jgi:hypothetical protein
MPVAASAPEVLSSDLQVALVGGNLGGRHERGRFAGEPQDDVEAAELSDRFVDQPLLTRGVADITCAASIVRPSFSTRLVGQVRWCRGA